MTTIPLLDPIIDAVRAVRAELSQMRHLPARILAGDAEALAEGRALVAAIDQLHDVLVEPVDRTLDLDRLALEELLGVSDVVQAVLVAIGEQDSDDPDVQERLRPVRLENRRRFAERYVDELLVLRSARPLTAIEQSLLDQCEHDLDLIAAGIEPE